ncbi:MAG: HK97-gp10 family putative phage morphogenesis protein [Candidatus Limiplasma sp.]|nr:HK97-gp10 family putative phage morphogenesis protein [Candidatus Limiplasma sp.]
MARMFTQGLDEAIAAAELEADRIERNGDDAIRVGAAVAVGYLRKEAPERTGGLRQSIQAMEIKIDANSDRYSDILPDGYNKYGERYATIGFVLEYGRSNMPPNPWMRRAVQKGEKPVGNAMLDVLRRD